MEKYKLRGGNSVENITVSDNHRQACGGILLINDQYGTDVVELGRGWKKLSSQS